MFSKKLVALVVFAMLMPMIAACGGTEPTATPAAAPATEAPTAAAPTEAPAAEATNTAAPSGGGTTSSDVFKWRAYAEPETFDTALMQENLSIDIGQNLYDGLTEFDVNTLEVKPNIATSWDTSPDGTVYTFHLNKDAKFSNGDPVTAEDFKYSWNRVLSTPKAPYAYVLDDIKGATDVEASAASTDTTKTKVTEASGIVVKDPQTLEVTLKGPSAYFLSQTALWTYYVVNKKVVSQCPADKASCFTETGKHMGAGSGPYYIETWNHDQNIKLKVNKDYWRKDQAAAVDAEVLIVKDTTTAQSQFENGQLDVLDQPDAKDIKRIQDDPKLKDQLHKTGYARTVWIGFNVQ